MPQIHLENLSQMFEIMSQCQLFSCKTLTQKADLSTYFNITQPNSAKVLKLVKLHCSQVKKSYLIGRFRPNYKIIASKHGMNLP